MKILRLRFSNLNSLYGEWSIDFTHNDYATDGIFAITGPTGSGKSTILDAICLALYGRTPRLDSITQSGNEIMSRQTGDCFAEVCFETLKGTFRCHWSQHRARRQSDGRLADSRHEISNLADGRILETKKREVALAVETLTGMDFERFTRSMLLAQGSFAAFLTAAPDERSPILEQITGTEIYSEVSKRVHERRSEEQAKLDILSTKVQAVTLLGEAEEAELQDSLGKEVLKEQDLTANRNMLQEAIAWLDGLQKLHEETVAISHGQAALELEQEAFRTDRLCLEKAVLASELDGEYVALSALRALQAKELSELETTRQQIPAMEATWALRKKTLDDGCAFVVACKERLQTELLLIKQVRELDSRLAVRREQLGEAAKLLRGLEVTLSQTQGKMEKAAKRLTIVVAEKEKAHKYLDSHTMDETLLTTFSAIDEQLKNYTKALKAVNAAESLLSTARKSEVAASVLVEAQRMRCVQAEKDFLVFQQEYEKLGAEKETVLAGRSLREYRLERDSLAREQLLLARIASLEDERSRLEDSIPCPLCGSLHHPYALGNIPVHDGLEADLARLDTLISAIEAIDDRLRSQEVRAGELKSAQQDGDKQLALLTSNHEKTVGECERLEQELTELRGDVDSRGKALRSDLAPFREQESSGAQELPLDDSEAILGPLRARLIAWKSAQSALQTVQNEEDQIQASTSIWRESIEDQSLRVLEGKSAFEILSQTCTDLAKERELLYGGKNTDLEEALLMAKLSDAELLVEEAKDAYEQAERSLREKRTYGRDLQRLTEQRVGELESYGKEFSKALLHLGFADETAYNGAKLSKERRLELQSRAKMLDDRQTVLLGRKADCERRLEGETQKALTAANADALKQDLAQISLELTEVTRAIGALKQRLDDNNRAKELFKEHHKALELQKEVCSDWEDLHKLIGSADGKRYRNFAQGLTFEIMIAHANKQLALLTDRYLLLRDEQRPLELNVMDNYQGVEIRSTKNLSGGESFVVSLALALGLSHMNSHKVRVDSLFLDEGFGTLDEEALEAALNALSSLRSHGKLIGIISHVGALKERIGVQISVTPVSAGRSVLNGPGCERL